MPHVVVSRRAFVGILRCRRFLEARNKRAAQEASAIIDRQLLRLKTQPEIGRLLPKSNDVRELVIPFGNAGYVARYRYAPDDDLVLVTGFRHQREAGY